MGLMGLMKRKLEEWILKKWYDWECEMDRAYVDAQLEAQENEEIRRMMEETSQGSEKEPKEPKEPKGGEKWAS